jgi:hypothetical protein
MKRAIGCAYLAFCILGLIQILIPQLEAQNREGKAISTPSTSRVDIQQLHHDHFLQ